MATFELRISGELPELAPIAAALGGVPPVVAEKKPTDIVWDESTTLVVKQNGDVTIGGELVAQAETTLTETPAKRTRGPAKAKATEPGPQSDGAAAPDTNPSSGQATTQSPAPTDATPPDGSSTGRTAPTDASPSDLNACRKLLSELMDSKGTPAAIAALAPFGASLTAIANESPTPEKWGEIAAALEGAK